MVRLRSRVAEPRPPRRAGFSVGALLILAAGLVAGHAADLDLRLVDAQSGQPVAGAAVALWAPGASTATRTAVSDTGGAVRLSQLAPGPWQVRVEALAYRPLRQTVAVAVTPLPRVLRLQPRPLVMDEVVVRARSDASQRHPTAFVESLPVAARDTPGADLAQTLDRATGVDVRRYGGLGSFSTVSIRGASAQQVLVFLDGVPLNQALGGGVDLGGLPLGGVESVEVYRGAVPARFGGNSLGGVVHIRTRGPSGGRRGQLRLQSGSFRTRQLTASATAPWRGWAGLALVDLTASRNDFRFWDDNGTEYNPDDDGWARRRNADFASLRALAKAGRGLGQTRLQVHATLDGSHRGIPGIGVNQALHTRYDTWRGLSEALLFGPLADSRAGYRLKAWHTLERAEYRDLRGEVGIGTQHECNTTRGLGLRGELNGVARGSLVTLFAEGRQERFEPADRLRPRSRLRASRRRGGTLGAELEAPVAGRVTVNAGTQVERLDDRLYDAGEGGARATAQLLWGWRLGAGLDLGGGWSLQGHRGRYARAPGFFELFGDRGAVLGNADLASESGRNLDAGLLYRGAAEAATGVLLAEAAAYRNRVDDLIRFVQNSQRVSQPHNIGGALLRGVETRLQARVAGRLQVEGGYTYQRDENRSPFAFERGNDLPNAPRHRVHGRIAGSGRRGSLYWEGSRESRSFLDRASLRPVAARTVHSVGGRTPLAGGFTLAWELRNLTDNRVADLWGYPLPGRSWFLSLSCDLPSTKD